MAGARLVLGTLASIVGCASGETEANGPGERIETVCGLSQSEIFELELGRVTLAPSDSDGNPWDSAQPDEAWSEDLMEWRQLSRTVSTDGAFDPERYKEVEALNEYFGTSLFVPTAAPDPEVAVYRSEDSGESWDKAQVWPHLEANTHQVNDLFLGRWSLDLDRWIKLRISDVDAPDSTRVGVLEISAELAQSIADCGPLSLVLSETEMRNQESRIHAMEIEVVSID